MDVHLLHATVCPLFYLGESTDHILQIDTALSLLGFALTINAAILTLAGAAFFFGASGETVANPSLAGAHSLIKSFIGNGAAIIFALALLCVGLTAHLMKVANHDLRLDKALRSPQH